MQENVSHVFVAKHYKRFMYIAIVYLLLKSSVAEFIIGHKILTGLAQLMATLSVWRCIMPLKLNLTEVSISTKVNEDLLRKE